MGIGVTEIIILLVFIAIVGGIGLVIWLASRSNSRTSPSPSNNPTTPVKTNGPGGNGAKQNSPPTSKEISAAQEAMLKIRIALQGLVGGLGRNIRDIQGDADTYDQSLEEHREALQKLVTVEDLKELEKSLLSQVEVIQKSNDRYRTQLTEVNAKVEEQQEELEQLQTEAGQDFLTGIANRKVLSERTDELLSLARRHGNVFSIIMFDIDHFKRVNDTYGHLAGDRILKAVASLINAQRRVADIFGRYGGEEFVMVLPETGQEQAAGVAEKIRERVEKAAFKFEDQTIKITISIGVGSVNVNDSETTFLKRVDDALYKAKLGGRNRVVEAI
jgi:diguanylate cyclase